jgi:hypothetical protein
MEVSGQLKTPASLILDKNWIADLLDSRGSLDAVVEKQIMTLPGIEPQSTLYPIDVIKELFRLHVL